MNERANLDYTCPECGGNVRYEPPPAGTLYEDTAHCQQCGGWSHNPNGPSATILDALIRAGFRMAIDPAWYPYVVDLITDQRDAAREWIRKQTGGHEAWMACPCDECKERRTAAGVDLIESAFAAIKRAYKDIPEFRAAVDKALPPREPKP